MKLKKCKFLILSIFTFVVIGKISILVEHNYNLITEKENKKLISNNYKSNLTIEEYDNKDIFIESQKEDTSTRILQQDDNYSIDILPNQDINKIINLKRL